MNTATALDAITLDESQRLIRLEDIIKRGQTTFVEVGNALAEIKESRLYRCDHPTFEAYCTHKWGFSRQHAYRLIACAPIAECNPQVTSVNQARALARVPKEHRAEVIARAAVEGQPLTAGAITEAGRVVRVAVESKQDESNHTVVRVAVENQSSQPTPDADGAADFQSKFRSATKTSRAAKKWWFQSATPQMRARFFWHILGWSNGKKHRVEVEDRAEFEKLLNRWLNECVIERRAGKDIPTPADKTEFRKWIGGAAQ